MYTLVVDDEIVSRTKLETLMGTFGQCQSAENGGQALTLFQNALDDDNGFELILLDIDMPDMQGTEVLKCLRAVEETCAGSTNPRAVVIMVTAQADQDHVMACIQNGCNDYITKPFNIDTIKDKLSKLGLLKDENSPEEQPPGASGTTPDKIFHDISLALRNDEIRLPALPQISAQFRKLVQTNADLDDMAKLLKKDGVLVSKLIRVANSALYRGYGAVQTAEQAIGRVGLSETEKVVTAITSQKLFLIDRPKYRAMVRSLWEHSLATAYGAEILCQSLAKTLTIDAYTAGLFHDIGALALIDIIVKMDKLGRYGHGIKSDDLFETVEQYHAMFGAKLLARWGFETDYIRVVQFHNDLDNADALTDELLIVHFANLVSKALGYTPFGQPPTVELIEAPSTVKLQLAGHQIATIQQKVKTRMRDTEVL